MKFKDLHPPILELAPGQTFHRVQLTRARKTSVRVNGLLLAPTGLQSGRFCLRAEATAYLADSELTALYESMFRRDVHSRSLRQRRCLGRSHPHPLRRHAGGGGAVRVVYLARHARGALGRESTPEDLAFLSEPGSGF
jgi:hypothetical protein